MFCGDGSWGLCLSAARECLSQYEIAGVGIVWAGGGLLERGSTPPAQAVRISFSVWLRLSLP
ncbi:MAG: hypothetical protein Q8L76_02665, partial [Cypionkella sp.]|nr:hypothetical protein [Cypionkella sp.]